MNVNSDHDLYTNVINQPLQPEPPPPPPAAVTQPLHVLAAPFHHAHPTADIVQVPDSIFAYMNIFPQFHPDHPPTHGANVPPFHAPPPPPPPELGLHPYTLVGNANALPGLDNIAIILNRLLIVLYNAHLVHEALAPVQPPENHDPHAHPAAEVIFVYEGLTATQGAFHPLTIHHVTPHKQAQQVPVASAAQAVCHEAAFQSRAIFAVPVSVKVPRTYIAYPAGSRTIPVLTVKLL